MADSSIEHTNNWPHNLLTTDQQLIDNWMTAYQHLTDNLLTTGQQPTDNWSTTHWQLPFNLPTTDR